MEKIQKHNNIYIIIITMKIRDCLAMQSMPQTGHKWCNIQRINTAEVPGISDMVRTSDLGDVAGEN